jgi:hypothetical protein
MKWSCKAAKTVLLIAVLGPLSFLEIGAQTPSQPAAKSADAGLHVDIVPYLWFSGISGTVGVLGREASPHAGFSDIFSYLNIGLMGGAEIRYNRIIVPTDVIWMKLSDDKAIPIGQTANSIKAKMTETLLTSKVGYRVVEGERVKVDALVGIRYWHMSTDLTLQPTQVGGGFSDSANWVDAIGGAKITAALTPKVFVTVMGDAGGGSADSDYQVGGFLGYRICRKCVLQAGYRYLSVNYRPNSTRSFVYDVNMPGVLLGMTINVK